MGGARYDRRIAAVRTRIARWRNAPPWLLLGIGFVVAAILVGVLARPEGEDARATATLAVTVLVATVGLIEASTRSREERRDAAKLARNEQHRGAMREAGEVFCTAVSTVNSALTGLRFSLEPAGDQRRRIETAMTAVTTSIDGLQAATARVEFAFPTAARDAAKPEPWPSQPARQLEQFRRELARADERVEQDDVAGTAVDTALLTAVVARHAADVLRSCVRTALETADTDPPAGGAPSGDEYADVQSVLNGLHARSPSGDSDGEGGDYPPSLRTTLTSLRRLFVRQALNTMDPPALHER